MSDLTFARSIAFNIPGSKGTGGVKITAVEDGTGGIVFSAEVLNSGKSTYDLRGLFFNFNDDSKLTGLNYSGASVTAFDTVNVIDLGKGVNLQGAATPFDVGLGFGLPGATTINSTSFTLTNAAGNLVLDDIANVTFGARLTSNANSGSSKLVATSPAAPDAVNDSYTIFEDGKNDLNDPASTATGVVFQVLANDSDADHNALNIVAVRNVEHGSVEIVDGNDADTLIGDAIKFTPATDYAGPASFEYAISDGAGGSDFAQVDVAIDAVADVSDFEYEITAGASTNQMILRVTAAPTDNDFSEFIDRIELSGYSGKVQSITTTGQHPVANAGNDNSAAFDLSGKVIQDFVITLNQGQDTDFDLGITVVAKESANGDEQSASTSLNVRLEHNVNDRDTTFSATNQSMWKEGGAYEYSNSWDLGFDKGWNTSDNWNLYDGILGHAKLEAGTNGRIAANLTPEVTFNGGNVDASAPYDISFTTDYNKTTDVLEISSSAGVQSGVTLATEGPGGNFTLLLDAYFKANFYANLNTSIGNKNLFDKTIGPWEVNDYELLNFDSSEISIDIPVTDFASITAAWPTVSSSGSYTASGSSNNFLQANLDVDKLLSDIVWLAATKGKTTGINPLGDEIDVTIAKGWYDLFDVDVNAGLNFLQDFTLSLDDLSATIIYENGVGQSVVIGQDLILQNASTYDANHNGTIEFTVALDPLATLQNDTDLGFNVGYGIKALEAGVSYNLGFVSDSYQIGPLWAISDSVPITTVGVYDQTFNLDFASQNIFFSA